MHRFGHVVNRGVERCGLVRICWATNIQEREHAFSPQPGVGCSQSPSVPLAWRRQGCQSAPRRRWTSLLRFAFFALGSVFFRRLHKPKISSHHFDHLANKLRRTNAQHRTLFAARRDRRGRARASATLGLSTTNFQEPHSANDSWHLDSPRIQRNALDLFV
jgi:hypothetical protein